MFHDFPVGTSDGNFSDNTQGKPSSWVPLIIIGISMLMLIITSFIFWMLRHWLAVKSRFQPNPNHAVPPLSYATLENIERSSKNKPPV